MAEVSPLRRAEEALPDDHHKRQGAREVTRRRAARHPQAAFGEPAVDPCPPRRDGHVARWRAISGTHHGRTMILGLVVGIILWTACVIITAIRGF
jgi:hypothetical protein